MSTNFTERHAIAPDHAAAMDTTELRENFLVDDLFASGSISLTYTHYDRMIVGGAVPASGPLPLDPIKPTGTENFLDRRELIAVNIGAPGTVSVDGKDHALGTRDMIYVGMGAKSVSFASAGSEPAKFYLLSAPAHATYPTTLIKIDDAKRLDLGASETCNERSIFQFSQAIQTCQLVVGMTTLAPGSIWNTMPAHVHSRRMEAYLYFDLASDQRVMHFMGEPTETRHLVVANEQAVLSPPWSIHSGVGTGSYTFIWAMAGDNVDYTDVEPVQPGDLL
ncbi:5-dehydro-4-deoxy-D-glucuronate isomerase [Pelagibacterium sp. 26DY04]|uniref:5-dehydro-4-deoxy-D-glucuronate isomerase n=1 Tax=unclassified Pelagibacterium TaxID=2623280 RepID=UPI002814F0FF|nr:MULTISPECIES: 5-dehydro-4-deoxy-D-glucuronate isomerase [unclassified Pelagibacterium]WMT85937.1 5-dehydro-4-deoxy-D-glucuronate isomerase [Pelagibacterium sp. 26DY04]WMT89778.1 5-dehydro-4-deoxy-D-glucuronate isomerase [Pelagibacterium sp. H642]